jgi:transcriptional regulator with XRE-family HTH domain
MDRQAFSRFVRRAVDDAKNRRGWTVTRLAAETGVGRSTLFRWLAGDCHEFPEIANVHSFCAALDIPVGAAFAALGVRGNDGEAEAWSDAQRVLLRLSDPSVPAAEKRIIRDMLRYLAQGATPYAAGPEAGAQPEAV